jgi:hypothetical protein
MLKRLKPYVVSEEDEVQHKLAEWIFDSHNWVEEYAGYYICAWCGVFQTSTSYITPDMPLCSGNPAVKRIHDQEGVEADGRDGILGTK